MREELGRDEYGGAAPRSHTRTHAERVGVPARPPRALPIFAQRSPPLDGGVFRWSRGHRDRSPPFDPGTAQPAWLETPGRSSRPSRKRRRGCSATPKAPSRRRRRRWSRGLLTAESAGRSKTPSSRRRSTRSGSRCGISLPFTGLHCASTVFHCLTLRFHRHSVPFTVLSPSFTAFHWPSARGSQSYFAATRAANAANGLPVPEVTPAAAAAAAGGDDAGDVPTYAL